MIDTTRESHGGFVWIKTIRNLKEVRESLKKASVENNPEELDDHEDQNDSEDSIDLKDYYVGDFLNQQNENRHQRTAPNNTADALINSNKCNLCNDSWDY